MNALLNDRLWPALLGVDTVWLCQLSLFEGSTIDHAMSSKGTAEEQQFLIEFIYKNIGHSLPALWCVTSTEYRNKKNEQNAKLLNKYREKYRNVEKKCVTQKIIIQ